MAAAELCRRRLSFFVQEFWEEIIAEQLVWNWHMDVLCDELQTVYNRVFLQVVGKDDDGNDLYGRLPKLYDLIINIPPGTSKSTIVSVMAPAWSWTADASLRHITASYSGDLAMELAEKSRDIIQSYKYRLYFPALELKRDRKSLSNYKNEYNGQRYSTSVGGTITGIHAHIITVDDPLNPKQAASVAELTTTNKWFDATLSTRKVDKKVTPTILVMQRLATNDPSGYLLEKQKKGIKIRHICLPASVSDNVKPVEYKKNYVGGLLDPERMPWEVLTEMKITLGSAGYAGQMDQTPVPDGGLIWKQWFISVPDVAFPPARLMQNYGTDWDLAYTKEDTNSASAYVTSGRIGQKRYIDDIGWDWLEFPALITYMKKRPSPHYIEAKASGKSAKQALVKKGIAAIEIAVKGGDKVARANMATPDPEAGMWYIRESLADRLYNDSKQGILFFPKGAFTDLADALAQAVQRHSGRNGVVVADGGGDTEDDEDSEGYEGYDTDDPLDWDD